MRYSNSTQVPNILFDQHLPLLTASELKIILVIIRQTNGWIDKRTGHRKKRDRLSYGQFTAKTGLSRRVVTKAIQMLIQKQLINVNCRNGKSCNTSGERRGNPALFYASTLQPARSGHVHLTSQTCAQSAHNKTNYTKINILNDRKLNPNPTTIKSIGDVIAKMTIA